MLPTFLGLSIDMVFEPGGNMEPQCSPLRSLVAMLVAKKSWLLLVAMLLAKKPWLAFSCDAIREKTIVAFRCDAIS